MKALYEHKIDTNNYAIIESILAEVPEDNSWTLYFAVEEYLDRWDTKVSKSGYEKIYHFCKKHELKPVQVIDWYFMIYLTKSPLSPEEERIEYYAR